MSVDYEKLNKERVRSAMQVIKNLNNLLLVISYGASIVLKRCVIFPPLIFISEEEYFEGVGHDTQDQGTI